MCTSWQGRLFVGWGIAEIQDLVSLELSSILFRKNKRKIHLNDIYIHIYLHFSQTHVKQAGLA